MPQWEKEGQKLDAILTERGIGISDFADSIGVRYYNVLRWRKGFEFGPANQRIAAAALGLPQTAFENGGRARKKVTPRPRRETSALETAIVLDSFRRERPQLAAELTPPMWRVMKSIRFYDAALRPSVAFFEVLALALLGAIPLAEVIAIAEENAALDRSLSHKPPLPRR